MDKKTYDALAYVIHAATATQQQRGNDELAECIERGKGWMQEIEKEIED
jgi:hypothetical protein